MYCLLFTNKLAKGSNHLDRIWKVAIEFLVVTTGCIIIGNFFGIEIISFIGSMTLASTFLPMPADTYVLYISPYYHAWVIGIVGGLINALAILFEKAWVKEVTAPNK